MNPPPERIQMSSQGRIVVPVAMRKALGFEPGTPLTARVVDGELHITSIDQHIRKYQEYDKRVSTFEGSAVDELLRWRREEARREFGR